MPFVIQWVESCSGAEEVAGVTTPVGQLVLYTRQDVITKIEWQQGDSFDQLGEHEIEQQLNQYWRSTDTVINLKLLKQGSAYRYLVWSELCQIPFGETLTYSALAKKIGSAARAVGNACRDNPYPLIIPCHRVVSVSGMGGYSGQTEGELMAIKCKLLAFEGA